MTVDIYHSDAVIPLTDRLELSFSLDRDTYSGASPNYSLPDYVLPAVPLITSADEQTVLTGLNNNLNSLIGQIGQSNSALQTQLNQLNALAADPTLTNANLQALNSLDAAISQEMQSTNNFLGLIAAQLSTGSLQNQLSTVEQNVQNALQSQLSNLASPHPSASAANFAHSSMSSSVLTLTSHVGVENSAASGGSVIAAANTSSSTALPVLAGLSGVTSSYRFVDIVSGASQMMGMSMGMGGISAAMLTQMGLETFSIWQSLYNNNKPALQTLADSIGTFAGIENSLLLELGKDITAENNAIADAAETRTNQIAQAGADQQTTIANAHTSYDENSAPLNIQISSLNSQVQADNNQITEIATYELPYYMLLDVLGNSTSNPTLATAISNFNLNFNQENSAYAQSRSNDHSAYTTAIAALQNSRDQSAANDLTALNYNLNNLATVRTADLQAAQGSEQQTYLTGNPRPADDASLPGSPTNIGFDLINQGRSITGKPNDGACVPVVTCISQNGMLFGVVDALSSPHSEHFHTEAGFQGSNITLGLHEDSSGIYFRAADQGAFSLYSLAINAPFGIDNPVYGANAAYVNGVLQADGSNIPGPNEKWEILGFNTALNPTLAAGDGTHYPGQVVAYQTVTNGTVGTVNLNPAFENVKSIWIHYDGHTVPVNDASILFHAQFTNFMVSSAASAWDSTYNSFIQSYMNTFTANYDASTYTPAVNQYNQQYNQQIADLDQQLQTAASSALSSLNSQLASLQSSHDAAIAQIDSYFVTQVDNLLGGDPNLLPTICQIFSISGSNCSLSANPSGGAAVTGSVVSSITGSVSAANAAGLAPTPLSLQSHIGNNYCASTSECNSLIASLTSSINNNLNPQIKTLQDQLIALNNQLQSDLAKANQALASSTNTANSNYNTVVNNAQTAYNTATASAYQNFTNSLTQAAQSLTAADLAAKTAAYRSILDGLAPKGAPTVQKFANQPLETRSQPQFSGKYYFDSSSLALSGGYSDEPDYLSNFGAANYNLEFNDKLSTLAFGYGMTSNWIGRNMMQAVSSMSNTQYGPSNYPALNGRSESQSFSAGLSQVLGKNSMFQTSVQFNNQAGYLSNAYKNVYIRGLVTADQYAAMSNNAQSGGSVFNAIAPLQMVGLDVFRENRPGQRNTWSFSNQLNQHLPGLDASLHLDYRFYTDDWGINSHTFSAKWFQSLGNGWVATPSIRYYSQSQAYFFAPYFLAPRADNFYSSDYRLSAYGDLSGGISISKKFAKGVKLETSFEYVTHAGGLKLGGGGIGSYADFDYLIAHANLNVDLSAKLFSGSDGESAGHAHQHHHGAPLPAGVMYGHMMNQSDQIMVGYRMMYSGQSGAMLHGGSVADKQGLIANACPNSLGQSCNYAPGEMNMTMQMLDLMYAPSDWLNLMLMPQLVSMDMTMGQPLNGMESNPGAMVLGGVKMTSLNLGDTYGGALVKILDENQQHVHAAVGLNAPTGNVNIKMADMRMDYGMQTGSGSWDFKPSLTYTGQYQEWGWGMQLSGIKHLQKNKYGYTFGDQFQFSSWGSYQLLDWLSASLRGLYTLQDHIHGQNSSPPTSPMSLSTSADAGNYGGRFFDIGFGLNASVQKGQFAGHSLSVEWLQPVATDFNGYQLERNGALSVSWNYAF